MRAATSPRRSRRPCLRVSAVGVLVALLAGCSGGGATPSATPAGPADRVETSAPMAVDELATPATLGTSADGWPAATALVETGRDRHAVGVRVADTSDRRAQGLMGVAEIPAGTGAWFSYDEDHEGGFWMRGTLTDIDIAWVDAAGTIVGIETMPRCEADPCPTYDPGVAYRAALEVAAGWFAARGVAVGDRIELVDETP